MSRMLDSDEGELLNALFLLAAANRELDYDTRWAHNYQRKQRYLQERITSTEEVIARNQDMPRTREERETVRRAIDTLRAKMDDRRSRIETYEGEVRQAFGRAQGTTERIASACRELFGAEAANLFDISDETGRLKPIQSLLDNNRLWETLDHFRQQSQRLAAATRAQEVLKEKRAEVDKRAALSSKQLLGARLKSGVDENDVFPELLSQPDLQLLFELAMEEPWLKREIEDCRYQPAEGKQFADMVEAAFIEAGLMMPYNPSDWDVDDQEEEATGDAYVSEGPYEEARSDANDDQGLDEEASSEPLDENIRAGNQSSSDPRDIPAGRSDYAMDDYDGEGYDGIE